MSARLDPFNLEQQEELLTPLYENKKHRQQSNDFEFLYPENLDLGFQTVRVEQQQQQQQPETRSSGTTVQSNKSGVYSHQEGSFFEAGAVLIIIVGVAVVAGKLNSRVSYNKKRRNVPPIANRLNPKKVDTTSSQISTAHSKKQKKQQQLTIHKDSSTYQADEKRCGEEVFCKQYVYNFVNEGKCECRRLIVLAFQFSKEALQSEVEQLFQGSSQLLVFGKYATQVVAQNVRQVSHELHFYVRNKLEKLQKLVAIVYKHTKPKTHQKQSPTSNQSPHSLSQPQNRKKNIRTKAKPETNHSERNSFSSTSTLEDSSQLPAIYEEDSQQQQQQQQQSIQSSERESNNCNCTDEGDQIIVSQDSNQNLNFNCESEEQEDGWVEVLQGGKTSCVNLKIKNKGVDINSQLENNHRKQRHRIDEEVHKEQEQEKEEVDSTVAEQEECEVVDRDCLQKGGVDVDKLTVAVTDDFSDDFVPQTPPLTSDISQHAASSSYDSAENTRVLSEDSNSLCDSSVQEGHKSPQAVLQWIGGGSMSGPPSINSSPPPSQQNLPNTPSRKKTKNKNPHDFPTPRKNHKKVVMDNNRLVHQVLVQQQTYNQWLNFYEKENQYQQWLYWNQQQQYYQQYWQSQQQQQKQQEAEKQYQIWYQHQKQQQYQKQQQVQSQLQKQHQQHYQQQQQKQQHQLQNYKVQAHSSSQKSFKVDSVQNQKIFQDIHKYNRLVKRNTSNQISNSNNNNNNLKQNYYYIKQQKFRCEQKDDVIPSKQQCEGGQGIDFRERLFCLAVRERTKSENTSFENVQSQNQMIQLMQKFQSFGPGTFR